MPTPVPHDPLIGETVLGCRLAQRLGSGATAVVYGATRLVDGRDVAVKILTPRAARDPETVTLHRQEAEVGAALAHPNLVPVLRYGRDRGVHVLVMERAAGESLAQRLQREGPMPWREAADIIAQVAGAVEHLRRQGIVHRDIKPDNIIVADGVARLVDLGFARAVSHRQGAAGIALGTPPYMAPEEISGGQDIAHGIDVYALGATLFHAVTGEPPYDGEDEQAVLRQVLHSPAPAARSLDPTLPPALDALLAWCLAKDPAQRPATAGDLQRLIHNILADPEDHHSVRRLRQRDSSLILALLIAFVLGGTLVGWVCWSSGMGSRPPVAGRG